ncbi:MAG: agmatinase [Actinomycetota bacterium]|jgi:guanidinobutyrase
MSDSEQGPLPQPLGGNVMPRFAGPATMMRLPPTSGPLDAAFVGVPLDIGTSNRSGARFGPREIRAESCLLRPYNMATRAAPFDSLRVGDGGDVALNTFNLAASIDIITNHYRELLETVGVPLSMGGDHTITYPIVRALAERHGPIGMVHVDAHADVNRSMFGERITHGSWLRHAIDDGYIDPRRTVQIGLRGTGYAADDFDWIAGLGARVVPAEECWHRSLTPLMAEVQAQLGDAPMYLSFDIDGLDPSVAPGTGTPEIGGLTGIQGLEIIRGLRGASLVGADLVEVAPAYDASGNTALVAANLLFEILCVLPGVQYRLP